MYEFVNVWPSDLTSMRVAYGDSNVLKCTIQFAYDRFFTTFNNKDIQKQVINRPDGVVNSNDQQGFDMGSYFSKQNTGQFAGQTIDPKYQIGDGAGFI